MSKTFLNSTSVDKKTGAYHIYPEYKLILEYYSGTIVMDDFIQLKKIIADEPEYDPRYYSLLDFRDAYVKVNEADMMRYFEFMRNFPKIHEERYTAYFTNTPNDAVVTIIFSTLLQERDIPVHAQMFSTAGAILKYFGIKNLDVLKLNRMLDQNRSNPNNVII